MPRTTFFPLGNADCCLIDLNNGKKLLFDYAATRDQNDKDDRRIDLPAKLRELLAKDGFDLVAITHLDDDHTCGADEFFYLDHADKYQGKGRIKIATLWVPAGAITESRNDLESGARALQAEARHRLKKGYGVRVMSRPEALKDWIEKQGLTLDSRRQFITDAGQIAPEFTLANDGVEFFVHSPFAWRQDRNTLIDRNRDSLVVQATFEVDRQQTRLILGSDIDHESLSDIVTITQAHAREYRLEWDIMKLPHHCSYLSLGPDRGHDKTTPVPNVAWLFETQARRGCVIVSTSRPIPEKGSDADKSDQPPHRQAAAYYKDVAQDRDGEFVVTTEHPKASEPRPVDIDIDRFGATLKKRHLVGPIAITSTHAPRAG